MAHIYKVSALIPSDGMLHMQQLLHRAGARRLLQEAFILHASTHPPLSTGAISALTILAAPAPHAPPLISGQSQSSNSASTSFDTVTHFSPSVAIIMVALLSAFFFLGFFSLYVRRCADTSSSDARRPLRRANDLQDQQHQGVDMEFLHSLPLIAYSSAKKKGTNVECVVCLTEFEEREPLRQLPGCKHVFHQDCIDMWLFSHSTCPLCRRNITRSSGSFSLRWGGSGNFRQLSFLGGGGGSGQQLALLGSGGGSGQQLNAMDDTVMVVRMERESSNAIAGIQSTSSGQGHGSPSTDLNLTNPLQSAEMIVDSSHGNLGSESAVSSIMAAGEDSSDHASNRSRRLQVACSLARSNSTGHSLQLLMGPGPANEVASLWTDVGDSLLPRTSLHRWHSEMAEQHGNHAL